MLAPFLTLTIEAALLLGCMAALNWRSLKRQPRLTGLFFIAFYLDNLLITAASLYPHLRLIPNHAWQGLLVADWSGKLYSVLAFAALIWLCRRQFSPGELGLTLRQKPGAWQPAALISATLGLGFFLSGLPFPRASFDPQMLAYLALMPGLNEELVYRGVMLAAANRIFEPRWRLFGARLGWGAVLTTLIFALLHGFWLDPALRLHLLPGRVMISLFTGAVFAWLRERTGSLLFPCLAHSAVDFFAYFGRMV